MNSYHMIFESINYRDTRKQEQFIYICFLIVFTVLQAVNVLTGSYSYVLYIIPLIAIPFYLFYVLHAHRFFSNHYIKNMIMLYLGLAAYVTTSALIRSDFYERLFDEIGLILLPLIFAQILTLFYDPADKTKSENILLIGFIITYFLQVVVFPKQALDMSFDLSLFSTYSSFESGLSFIFAILYIYFLFQDSRKKAAISLLLTILSYKRIAIAGVCVVSLLYFFLVYCNIMHKQISRGLTATLAVAANLTIVFAIYQFINGAFDHLIINYLQVSANQLTTGRQVIYLELIRHLDLSTVGVGFGKTTELMRTLQLFNLDNLHSDVLKLYIEIGIIGFLPFMWLFFYINSTSMKTLTLAIFMNILWLTDNVFLYFQVMTVFYLLQSFLLMQNQNVYFPINVEVKQ